MESLDCTLDGKLSRHGGLPWPVHHHARVYSHVISGDIVDFQDLHPILLGHRHTSTGLQGNISLWTAQAAWSEKLLTFQLCLVCCQSTWDRHQAGSRALCSGLCHHAWRAAWGPPKGPDCALWMRYGVPSSREQVRGTCLKGVWVWSGKFYIPRFSSPLPPSSF